MGGQNRVGRVTTNITLFLAYKLKKIQGNCFCIVFLVRVTPFHHLRMQIPASLQCHINYSVMLYGISRDVIDTPSFDD